MEGLNPINPVRIDPLKQEPKEDFLNNPLSNPTFGNPMNESISPLSGPQFGETDGWGKKIRNWLNRYGSSMLLPIIAVLILAGGIYLYAVKRSPEASPLTEETPIQITEKTEELSLKEPGAISQAEETEETGTEVVIPESVKKEGQIIEKTVKGDGVTHLARRALKDYLQDKPQELTKEHKIYIEDYLKDKVGARSLEVGEEITFSKDLIKEAIDASLELTPNQLKNLEKYSALVSNL